MKNKRIQIGFLLSLIKMLAIQGIPSMARAAEVDCWGSAKIANGTIIFSKLAQNGATTGSVIQWDGNP